MGCASSRGEPPAGTRSLPAAASATRSRSDADSNADSESKRVLPATAARPDAAVSAAAPARGTGSSAPPIVTGDAPGDVTPTSPLTSSPPSGPGQPSSRNSGDSFGVSLERGGQDRRDGGQLSLNSSVGSGTFLGSRKKSKRTPAHTAMMELHAAVSDDAALRSRVRWRKGGEAIGRGAYGTVYLGMNEDTGELLAVKEIGFSPTREKEVQQLEHEINLMRSLAHTHIVRYMGAEVRDRLLYILTEWVPGGSLASVCEKFGALAEKIVRLYTRQILVGLVYLHDNRVIHRDIKGANILVDMDGTIKLADFGASRRLAQLHSDGDDDSDGLIHGSLRGTPYYMSPEIVTHQYYSVGSDVWAVGCTVLQLATGRPPWKGMRHTSLAALMHAIVNTPAGPPISKSISPVLKHFLSLCFVREPGGRASPRELLEHPFITGEPFSPVLHEEVALPATYAYKGRDERDVDVYGSARTQSASVPISLSRTPPSTWAPALSDRTAPSLASVERDRRSVHHSAPALPPLQAPSFGGAAAPAPYGEYRSPLTASASLARWPHASAPAMTHTPVGSSSSARSAGSGPTPRAQGDVLSPSSSGRRPNSQSWRKRGVADGGTRSPQSGPGDDGNSRLTHFHEQHVDMRDYDAAERTRVPWVSRSTVPTTSSEHAEQQRAAASGTWAAGRLSRTSHDDSTAHLVQMAKASVSVSMESGQTDRARGAYTPGAMLMNPSHNSRGSPRVMTVTRGEGDDAQWATHTQGQGHGRGGSGGQHSRYGSAGSSPSSRDASSASDRPAIQTSFVNESPGENREPRRLHRGATGVLVTHSANARTFAPTLPPISGSVAGDSQTLSEGNIDGSGASLASSSARFTQVEVTRASLHEGSRASFGPPVHSPPTRGAAAGERSSPQRVQPPVVLMPTASAAAMTGSGAAPPMPPSASRGSSGSSEKRPDSTPVVVMRAGMPQGTDAGAMHMALSSAGMGDLMRGPSIMIDRKGKPPQHVSLTSPATREVTGGARAGAYVELEHSSSRIRAPVLDTRPFALGQSTMDTQQWMASRFGSGSTAVSGGGGGASSIGMQSRTVSAISHLNAGTSVTEMHLLQPAGVPALPRTPGGAPTAMALALGGVTPDSGHTEVTPRPPFLRVNTSMDAGADASAIELSVSDIEAHLSGNMPSGPSTVSARDAPTSSHATPRDSRASSSGAATYVSVQTTATTSTMGTVAFHQMDVTAVHGDDARGESGPHTRTSGSGGQSPSGTVTSTFTGGGYDDTVAAIAALRRMGELEPAPRVDEGSVSPPQARRGKDTGDEEANVGRGRARQG